MADYVYMLYETYRDNNNYDAHKYDTDVVYATEDLANAEAQLRNDKHNDGYRRVNYTSALRAWETKHADWQALVAAGRRPAGTEYRGRPEFHYEKIWFVEEIEVIGIPTSDEEPMQLTITDGDGSNPMTMGSIARAVEEYEGGG